MEKLFDTIPSQSFAFGRSRCAEVLADALRKAPRTVLFTGGRSADVSGAAAFVEETAAQCGKELVRWNKISPEPDIETVLAMRDLLLETGDCAVCAAGGGSVLDAAKAALLLAETGRDIDSLFGIDRFSSENPASAIRRIIAIPTTSGTGSEATQYSNIVDRKNGVKRLIAEKAIVPQCALLVPEFTGSMPRSVTLATACDALAHLLEGFLNTGADAGFGADANKRALAGIKAIVANLPRVLDDPRDGEARRSLALAAALGGTVIRFKSTGLPHLCSFSWFGRIEHGMAVIMLLPHAWRYYLGNPAVAGRTMELSSIFPGGTPEEIIDAFCRFTAALGVPGRLADYPLLTPELMAQTAKSAGANRMKLELAPRPVPLEDSERILSQILTRAYKGE